MRKFQSEYARIDFLQLYSLMEFSQQNEWGTVTPGCKCYACTHLFYPFLERKSITGRKKDYWDYFCNCIESVKGVNDGIKYVKTVGDVRVNVLTIMLLCAFGDLPSAAEATIGHQWWPSATIGVHWYRSVSYSSTARWPLVQTGTNNHQCWSPMGEV